MSVQLERFWKADDHQWGSGQIHIVDTCGQKTFCGKVLSKFPGQLTKCGEYTCRACAKVVESRARYAANELRWKQQEAEREAEREAYRRQWWKDYNAYLESSKWKQKRASVLKRAGGRCEACGKNKATEVHHRTYDHLYNEPLFDLFAICRSCHEDITRMDRESRSRRMVSW